MSNPSLPLAWDTIQNSLSTLQTAASGYSTARRGIVTLPNGTRVFVKIGVDDNTKKWAQKEVRTYRFLEAQGYPHRPALLAVNDDTSAFAIDALRHEDQWNWTATWTEERLAATLAAMDTLLEIRPDAEHREYFSRDPLSEAQDGWKQLAASPEAQQILVGKLQATGQVSLANTLDVAAEAAHSTTFKFAQHGLVHNDIRAENCAWNPTLKQVKLVDWNWTQIGDQRIDAGALLVHVHQAGLDVTEHHADRLDRDALQWLAGFWLNAATQPMWAVSSEKASLRDYQLASGIAAFGLAAAI